MPGSFIFKKIFFLLTTKYTGSKNAKWHRNIRSEIVFPTLPSKIHFPKITPWIYFQISFIANSKVCVYKYLYTYTHAHICQFLSQKWAYTIHRTLLYVALFTSFYHDILFQFIEIKLILKLHNCQLIYFIV